VLFEQGAPYASRAMLDMPPAESEQQLRNMVKELVSRFSRWNKSVDQFFAEIERRLQDKPEDFFFFNQSQIQLTQFMYKSPDYIGVHQDLQAKKAAVSAIRAMARSIIGGSSRGVAMKWMGVRSIAYLKVLKAELSRGKSVIEAQEAAVKAGRSWYGYRAEQMLGIFLGLVSLFVPLAGLGMLLLAVLHIPYIISIARLQNQSEPTLGEKLQPMKILAPYSFPALLTLLNAHLIPTPIQFSIPFFVLASVVLLMVVARRQAKHDEQVFRSVVIADAAMRSSAATDEAAIDSSLVKASLIPDMSPSRLRAFMDRLHSTHHSLVQNAGFALQA